MSIELSPQARRRLRARAHALKPVVLIGSAGLSEAVLSEVDRSLEHHELLKVRFHEGSRDEIAEALEALCLRLDAANVQRVGKTATIYRERPREASSAQRRQRAHT